MDAGPQARLVAFDDVPDAAEHSCVVVVGLPEMPSEGLLQLARVVYLMVMGYSLAVVVFGAPRIRSPGGQRHGRNQLVLLSAPQ